MLDEVHSIPEYYTIKISLPGTALSKEIQVAAKSKTSTRIEASDLGLECIPDGAYKFSVDSCGVPYSRQLVLIPNLYCCYKKLISVEGRSEKSDDVLTQIYSTINASNIQNIKAANDSFKIAKKLLERIKCDCHC